jgi:hypothetical protein
VIELPDNLEALQKVPATQNAGDKTRSFRG